MVVGVRVRSIPTVRGDRTKLRVRLSRRPVDQCPIGGAVILVAKGAIITGCGWPRSAEDGEDGKGDEQAHLQIPGSGV